MSPFRPKGRTIWRTYVPRVSGGWKLVVTGTRHKGTADAMERMLRDLGPNGQREWDLLDAVITGKVTLGELYDAHRYGEQGLKRLRAELNDVDLAEYVEPWQQYLVGRVKDTERVRYRTMLDCFRPKGKWMASTVTTEACEHWLSNLQIRGKKPAQAATKRKYYAALSSFFGYVKGVPKAIPTNPVETFSPPPAPDPRVEFFELDEVIQIVQAPEARYANFFALAYGTAIEVSCALGLRRRDVNLKLGEIRARGTKAYNRDRVATIAEWALPYIENACANMLPDAPLFPGMNRWTVADKHRSVIKSLGLRALTLHEARDHWAVRMVRAGTPIEIVARQLGHKDAVMALKVYGRFVPTSEERRAWDQVATRREMKR